MLMAAASASPVWATACLRASSGSLYTVMVYVHAGSWHHRKRGSHPDGGGAGASCQPDTGHHGGRCGVILHCDRRAPARCRCAQRSSHTCCLLTRYPLTSEQGSAQQMRKCAALQEAYHRSLHEAQIQLFSDMCIAGPCYKETHRQGSLAEAWLCVCRPVQAGQA